jgi:hypothetical protein
MCPFGYRSRNFPNLWVSNNLSDESMSIPGWLKFNPCVPDDCKGALRDLTTLLERIT